MEAWSEVKEEKTWSELKEEKAKQERKREIAQQDVNEKKPKSLKEKQMKTN